jgi:hypothetical protein
LEDFSCTIFNWFTLLLNALVLLLWWSKTSNSTVLFCLLTNDCLGSAKDEKEVSLCIEELNAPSFYPSVVSLWINDSFERKDMERELLGKLFVSLCSGRHNLLSKQQLIDGLVLFALFSFLVTKYLTTLDGTHNTKASVEMVSNIY